MWTQAFVAIPLKPCHWKPSSSSGVLKGKARKKKNRHVQIASVKQKHHHVTKPFYVACNDSLAFKYFCFFTSSCSYAEWAQLFHTNQLCKSIIFKAVSTLFSLLSGKCKNFSVHQTSHLSSLSLFFFIPFSSASPPTLLSKLLKFFQVRQPAAEKR